MRRNTTSATRSTAREALVRLAVMSVLAGCSTQLPVVGQEKAAEDESPDGSVMSIKSDGNGVVTSTYDPDSGESQVLQASGDSAIRDASVMLPPGALAVAADISLGEGESLADSGTLEELALGEGATVTAAGPAVVISSTGSENASVPFTIALPFEAAELQLLSSGNLVVIRRTFNHETGVTELGIYPTADLRTEDGKVYVETIYFGAYQAVYSSVEVTEAKSVPTSSPIIPLHRTSELTGKWQKECDNRVYRDANNVEHSDGSRREAVTFGETEFSFVHLDYAEADCASSPDRFDMTGSYQIGEVVDDTTQAKAVDIALSAMIIALRSPKTVERFNAEAACGKSDWTVNEPAVFKGSECDEFFKSDKGGTDATKTPTATLNLGGGDSPCAGKNGPPALGKKLFTIYKVDGNRLFFGCSSGPEHDGTTPEKREDILVTDGGGSERVE